MLSRRNFLTGSAAVGVAAFRNDSLRKLLAAEPSVAVSPDDIARDEAYWLKVREAFDVESSFLYLNNGGVCPAPRSVRAIEQGYLDEAARAPAYYLFRKYEHRIDEVRGRLAKLFRASPDEIAVMPNATQGLFTAILGAPVVAGEGMVATSQDYPRVLTALNQRARRDRIVTSVVDVPTVPKSAADLALPLEAACGHRPKLVCFPSVAFGNGNVFPAKRITDYCRKEGVLTLVDGAHAIGQLPDTAASVGSDFYACCLHKWLLGPTGTGFLYVRKDVIPSVWPLNPADEALDKDIRKFEQFGTRNTGVLLAILEALDAHEAIGQERKAARLEYLRAYLIKNLSAIPLVEFGSALTPDLGRTLLAVRVHNVNSTSLAGWLMSKHNICLTGDEEFEAFRRELDGPLLANMTEFGKTPITPVSRFRDLGYQMVIFPMTAFRVMLKALDDTYRELLADGTQSGLINRMRTRQELYELIDYAGYDKAEKQWLGT